MANLIPGGSSSFYGGPMAGGGASNGYYSALQPNATSTTAPTSATAPTTNPRTGGLIGTSAGGNGSAGTNPTATGGWNTNLDQTVPGYDPNNPNVAFSHGCKENLRC